MPFTVVNSRGRRYFLHQGVRRLNDGRAFPFYYFSQDSAGALEQLPDGYEVHETGLARVPMVRKVAGDHAR